MPCLIFATEPEYQWPEDEGHNSPASNEDEKPCKWKASIPEIVAINVHQLIGDWCLSFHIVVGDDGLEEIGEEPGMGKWPAEVELSEEPAHKILNIGEEVDSLGEDKQVVHFVQQLIADENSMEQDDNNWHYVADVGQPSCHEHCVIGLVHCSVDFAREDVGLVCAC